MLLKYLKLTNFRNHAAASLQFGENITIIIGGNGAGKTNLLEAAQYAVCGRSFRTKQLGEMVAADADFLRLKAEGSYGGAPFRRSVSLPRGAAARIDPGGGPEWLNQGAVLCFSPDDLQLIKGPPALRRRFLDESISRSRPPYREITASYRKILAQRNSFLGRARAGFVRISAISPWDRQMAAAALEIYRFRRAYCSLLSDHLDLAWKEIAGGKEGLAMLYQSQLEQPAESPDPEAEAVRLITDAWAADMERLSSSFGSHRDDLKFLLGGKSLREFGSQGEQRAVVLALLLASRNLARDRGLTPPLLLLDDVMSELDPERRRLLMAAIGGEGQAIITAADSSLFSREELRDALVLELEGGSIGAGVADV
ncbi:MAG: DNA replication and repair protein RecF [Actinobacteria bacterium]|nr:DNA replication and repair protein RecF [Actinomycetota bacterium]